MMQLEWGDAAIAEAAYLPEKNIAEFAEINEINDQSWLVITVENGGIALTGTKDELLKLLATAFTQVLNFA